MTDGYAEQTWADGADGGTPLDAERLTHMEQGIDASIQTDELDGAVATLLTTGASQTATAAAANVIAAVQTASTVLPTGNWNFAQSPTVAGSPLSTTPADGSITNAKVASGAAISADKLADGTSNKIMTAAERTKVAGLATVASTGAYADLSGKPTIPAAFAAEDAVDAVGAALTAGSNVTVVYDDPSNTITISAGASSIDWSLVPAGSVGYVPKTSGTWPSRPTSRSDVMFIWRGADPAPTIVSSGTGGMLDGVDEHHVTP